MYFLQRPLSNQIIVITGASSGIGLATALTAAQAGAKVVIAARSGDTLAAIVKQITSLGGKAICAVADVAERAQVKKIADAAIAHYGRVDTWVNNAGVSVYGRLDEVSEEDSRRLFDTNFWGTVNGSLVALPLLKRHGGALINVGCEVSEPIVPLQGMYASSKQAVKTFTDALRVEIAEIDGAPVAITLIQPTAVNTPYPQHARNYTTREPRIRHPQLDPQLVADAILEAACKPRRDVKVGAVAMINSLIAKVAPGLADALSARQLDRQYYEEPARNPQGTLHTPGHTGQIRGSGPSISATMKS